MTDFERDTIVTGCVTGTEKYGIFVSLENGYTGLIHISEISPNFVRNVNDFVNIGETIRMKVVEVDPKTHQVKLSIKNFDYRISEKKKEKIKETPNGFNSLRELLPVWIDNKYKELFNDNN